MIHPDMYGTVNGYFYDMVRTTVAGRNVSAAQREVLEASVAVVEHIIAAMRPGVACGELFERGATWLAEQGFDARAPRTPGRGDARAGVPVVRPQPRAGLGEPVDRPRRGGACSRPGMVMAVEAQVGRPGAGTGAFEHDVVVTDDGVEVLTTHVRNVWWE